MGGLLRGPTCPKQNSEKASEPGNPRTKLDPHTSPRTMRAREQPIPRRPPCPAPLLPGAPRPPRHREVGRRLRTPTGAARPRGRRESARHKARRGPGGPHAGRDGGRRGAPAAPSCTARGLLRAGGAAEPGRCVRPTVPPGRRGRAGVSPRPPPPSPAGRAGRERRRRFTTGPGGREAPHAAACSAGGYIYPARSLPQRARPSQSESGARPHSDAGWPIAVRRRAES